MLRRATRAVLWAAVLSWPALTGWLVRELRAPAAREASEAVFEVAKGRSARGVLDDLRRAGQVRKAFPLRLACRLFYPKERFKAGEFLLDPSAAAKENLLRLFRGRVHLEPVTVPEGLTGEEMAGLLRPDDPAGRAAFLAAFRAPARIADLDPQAVDLEGYLFPDTYLLPRRASEAELVAAMVEGFRKMFDAERRKRAEEIGMSVREVVILASLIEKETALPEERPLVSAVFHNRLRIGMKLDCDPTVIYALKRQGRFAGRLLLRDLEIDSPYNTYRHAGLPPGPICNPGRSAIDAALHPSPGGYLYFVLQSDGSHYFSSTLREHLEAVRRYQKLKNR